MSVTSVRTESVDLVKHAIESAWPSEPYPEQVAENLLGIAESRDVRAEVLLRWIHGREVPEQIATFRRECGLKSVAIPVETALWKAFCDGYAKAREEHQKKQQTMFGTKPMGHAEYPD